MNRYILLTVILLVFVLFTGAQNLEERYLSQANKEYLDKNYDQAYQYINFILTLHEDDELPLPARILGEKVYFFYLSSLIQTEAIEAIDDITSQLEKFPVIYSTRVSEASNQIQQIRLDKIEAARIEKDRIRKQEEEQKRIAEINKALQEERASQARLEAIREEERRLYAEKEQAFQEELNKIREAEIQRNEQQQEALREDMSLTQEIELQRSQQYQDERNQYEQRMIDLMAARDAAAVEQQKDLNEILQASLVSKDSSGSSVEKMSFYVIILISVIGLFLFMGFGLLIFLSIRHAQNDQKRFENTLYTMQSAQAIGSMKGQFALPDVTASIEHIQLEDNSGNKALPAPDDESEKIKDMLQICKEYGEKIDQATKRKNNYRNISELVFKVSKEMGHNEKESILHFAVGMVYDIGFLSIDPEILSHENVSEDDFNIIKNHVNLGLNMIYFIDKQFHPLFRDGILKHHENLDGSGYPVGLKDLEIPYIARVIHAVESFVSLVSSRNYKDIKDRESAMEQLMTETDKYDIRILEALHAIV